MVDDSGIGSVIVNAEVLQLQILVPRQHHQAAMEHRVNIVPEAGIVAVLVGIQAAAHFHILLDDHDLLAALGEIAGADHAVVAGTDDYAVVFQYFRHCLFPEYPTVNF